MIQNKGFIRRVARQGGLRSRLDPNNLAEFAEYAAFVLKGTRMG